ncbi:MAG: histidinol dehydrogenase [Chloroflexota bacterium]|nr:histidinol dehydrogenase [Chloroflexota bacterium]
MTEGTLVRIVRGAAEARRTLLRRQTLDTYDASEELAQGIERLFGEPLTPEQVVTRILARVKAEGDRALVHYTELLDDTKLTALRVPPERIEVAWQRTDAGLREALSLCAARIKAFHEKQPRGSWLAWDDDGGALGQRVRPLERVGIYAPHGRAPYPSSLLMAAIPARVAGVPQIAVATPPKGGALNDTILAAAHVAEIDEIYSIGGAQAIGALAYGTESVPRVDKILGPGNIFVVLAKRQVYGNVAIDQLPGPTETLLIADETASPRYAAADMLAQAEHDPLASALLITTSEKLARQVRKEIGEQIRSLARAEIIRSSLKAHGGIAVVDDLDQAIELANEYAPEHLCLLTADPWQLVGRIKNAGGIFVGESSSEALGDYAVGPSHIMPTGQTARFSSPLNVSDFLKITSIFAPGPKTRRKLNNAAIRLAQEEGLTAHAQAIRMRQDELDGGEVR